MRLFIAFVYFEWENVLIVASSYYEKIIRYGAFSKETYGKVRIARDKKETVEKIILEKAKEQLTSK
jgi:hypothetical protein